MTDLFLLGAKDPEMERIALILQAHKKAFLWATADGAPVTPSTAYEADLPNLEGMDRLVCIECEPPSLPKGLTKVSLDHHREGDAGYGRGARFFWEASSIGQLHKLLGIEPEKQDRLLAAMDHCFPAALRGECAAFGVPPEAVLELKIREILKGHPATTKGQVLKKIHHYEELIEFADDLLIGTEFVKDLRHDNLGTEYSINHLAAQVAVARSGTVALLHNRTKKMDRYTLYGNAKEETFRFFQQEWAPEHGYNLARYGVPSRGYAGAFRAITPTAEL